MIIDFTGLAVGTQLNTQFPEVTFLPYEAVVGGIVVDSPYGHVACFNVCPGCEFVHSGAYIAFSTLQKTVTVHGGLLPLLPVKAAHDIRLTAFDAGGTLLGMDTVNVTPGAGFAALTITIGSPLIASIILDIDPNLSGIIGIQNLTYENISGPPDFALQGFPAASVIQGNPPIDLPLTIRRIDGSTGDISFTLSTLPAGMSASIVPNPASTNSVVLRMQAAIGPAPEGKTVTVTGIPLTAAAGLAPRTLDIDLVTIPLVRVYGPASLNFSGCTHNIAHGTITADYQIYRDVSLSVPLDVSLVGLPADVTGTVDPTTLNFPGNVLVQTVHLSLTTLAGPNVPDTWATLNLTGQGVDVSFPILLYGTCPQQNRNFVIRGQFSFINEGIMHPLVGAQVEFYRYRSDWYDDFVGSTFTDDQGRFSQDLFASRDGDYYARIRLFSPEEAQVEDACNSSVWSYDTPRHTNQGGLVDVGSWVISRDGGQGTPRAAVWQGVRNAVLEFRQVTEGLNAYAAGGFVNVIVFRGHITPLTWYEDIHWAHGYLAGPEIFPEGAAQVCFQVTTHEFGHVVRDRLDGDFNHWNNDDTLYIYGRSHGSCYIQTGTIANAGFAFHEGWAEYWSQDITCCPNDLTNEAIEGTVAHDLNNLANCLFVDEHGNSQRIGRRGMVQVLARGENLIHSDSEFRREYKKQFPSCPLPAISEGCAQSMASAGSEQQMYPVLDRKKQKGHLVAAIDGYEQVIRELQEQQRSHSGMRALVLRAAAEEGALIVQQMQAQLAELDHGDPPELILQRGYLRRRERAEFVAKRRAIQVRALSDALAIVSPKQRPEVERRIRLLQESRIEDFSLDSLLLLPPAVGDDTMVQQTDDTDDEDDNDMDDD